MKIGAKENTRKRAQLDLMRSPARNFFLVLRACRSLIAAGATLAFLQNASAQFLPADDFFHGGAMSYLSNNIPAALESVMNGLAIYPNDEKLKKLEELLKQQQQQQNQQNQQQNNQSKDDQKDQQQKQNQKKDSSERQTKNQKQDEQKPPQTPQEKKDEQKKAEQQQAKKSDEQKPQDEKQDQAVAAGEMSPQEAKQLLDSQKNDELLMPVSRKDKSPDRQKAIKDW